MSLKKSQQQCSNTRKRYKNVGVKKKGRKKIYEASMIKGGLLRLIITTPASKLAQKVRDMFFQRMNEKK